LLDYGLVAAGTQARKKYYNVRNIRRVEGKNNNVESDIFLPKSALGQVTSQDLKSPSLLKQVAPRQEPLLQVVRYYRTLARWIFICCIFAALMIPPLLVTTFQKWCETTNKIRTVRTNWRTVCRCEQLNCLTFSCSRFTDILQFLIWVPLEKIQEVGQWEAIACDAHLRKLRSTNCSDRYVITLQQNKLS